MERPGSRDLTIRRVSRERFQRCSKGVASQARDYPLIQEVEEEGAEGHEGHAPRKVLNRPEEPTSGTTYKEHDLRMCTSSMWDREGLGDVNL